MSYTLELRQDSISHDHQNDAISLRHKLGKNVWHGFVS